MPFFNLIFDATSPNQVLIQRDSNKHQLEPDMRDLSQPLKIFKIFCLRLVLFLRKYTINTRVATYGHAIEFMNPWERQMLSLFMNKHRGFSKQNKKETTKQQPCICNAKRESKTRLLVKFDPRLGFFTPPKEGYRNRVRQALDALQKI
jgi:hypothetical protein